MRCIKNVWTNRRLTEGAHRFPWQNSPPTNTQNYRMMFIDQNELSTTTRFFRTSKLISWWHSGALSDTDLYLRDRLADSTTIDIRSHKLPHLIVKMEEDVGIQVQHTADAHGILWKSLHGRSHPLPANKVRRLRGTDQWALVCSMRQFDSPAAVWEQMLHKPQTQCKLLYLNWQITENLFWAFWRSRPSW